MSIVNAKQYRRRLATKVVATLSLISLVAASFAFVYARRTNAPVVNSQPPRSYQEKKPIDTGGFTAVLPSLERWNDNASLDEVSHHFKNVGFRNIERIERNLVRPELADQHRIVLVLTKAALFNYEGDTNRAYKTLDEARSWLDGKGELAGRWLYTVIYFQGVTARKARRK